MHGAPIDRSTQAWVRATGRRVDLAEYPWLDGPFGLPDRIGDEWLPREADRLGGRVADAGEDVGLLATMDDLAGPEFDPSSLQPDVRDFYEHTSRWRLEVWSQWCPIAWPFGWLISTLFARRLEQLSLPMRPLDVAHGMDSRVVPVVDRRGARLGAGWIRTARATGQTTYSGWYGITRLPGSAQPSVRVVFPLPNGSVTVFLRPEVSIDGALRLVSPLGEFGEEGAYLIVREADGRSAAVRRVPIVERFEVYVDADGILRTDHDLRLWNIGVIRLHYRIDRRPGSIGST
jgi:hypothetical protein